MPQTVEVNKYVALTPNEGGAYVFPDYPSAKAWAESYSGPENRDITILPCVSIVYED